MFQSLASRQSTFHTLNNLEVALYHIPNPVGANIGFMNFCNHFQYLTHLKICISKIQIDPTQQQLFGVIYVDILHNLLTLENLVFENMVLSEGGSEQDRPRSEGLVDVNTASSQLKSLSFSFETFDRNISMERYNLLL